MNLSKLCIASTVITITNCYPINNRWSNRPNAPLMTPDIGSVR